MVSILKKHWRSMVGAVAAFVLIAYVGLSFSIGSQVERAVAEAQTSERSEPVEALLAVVQSQEVPVAVRNRAVWALGQLGVREALPVLESLETAEECDHDSLLCQYEVKKAIKACSGSFNAGALVWRRGDLALN